VLKLLLYPFAILYDAVTSLRNTLYDRGYKPVASFAVPVIGVGNLTMGGTGKTPMIEYLIRLLTPHVKVAALSRGYGRSTKGFRFVSNDESAQTVGDEPYQIFKKFEHKIIVAVGEDRAFAIPNILHEHEDTNVILLDDSYQHRRVKPSFQILLTDYGRPFYQDFILPAGRLRESRREADRADVVVVTKCPFDLADDQIMSVEASIRQYTDKPVFFSGIRYGLPLTINKLNTLIGEKVVIFSGIANAKAFEDYSNTHFTIVETFNFPDHHYYSKDEIAGIVKAALRSNAAVLTTEKDAVKLEDAKFQSLIEQVGFFYLPVEMDFLKNGKEFDAMLLSMLKQLQS
jgi:tetraacyldisaccharide 4'-kinase